MIDMVEVNGFIFFQKYRQQNLNNESLNRIKSYALLDFREAVIRQLLDLETYSNPPAYKSFQNPLDTKYKTDHIPQFTEEKRNCKVSV